MDDNNSTIDGSKVERSLFYRYSSILLFEGRMKIFKDANCNP